jgi:SHS2 domain-containing protein
MVFAPYEYIDHTADLGFKARGATLDDMFVNAAQALFRVIVSPESVLAKEERFVDVRASALDSLLISWLNELIYLFDVERLLLCHFKMNTMSDRHVESVVQGECVDLLRHTIKTGVKAVTYHQVYVEKRHGLWESQVFLDL